MVLLGLLFVPVHPIANLPRHPGGRMTDPVGPGCIGLADLLLQMHGLSLLLRKRSFQAVCLFLISEWNSSYFDNKNSRNGTFTFENILILKNTKTQIFNILKEKHDIIVSVYYSHLIVSMFFMYKFSFRVSAEDELISLYGNISFLLLILKELNPETRY